MTLSPQPPWAQVHIRMVESPAFHDDCFRSSLWVNFLHSGGVDSWTVNTSIAGDYVVLAVTEGAAVTGAGWERDISALAIDTDDYPLIEARIRGGGTTPQYRIVIEFTDATTLDSGWIDADTTFFFKRMQLTAAKVVDTIRLYGRSNTAFGTATIDYDYIIVAPQPPIIPDDHFELSVDLRHTVAVSGYNFKIHQDILLGVAARKYSFEDHDITGNTRAYDLSFNKGHATLVNTPNFVAGKYGYCLRFVSASSERAATDYSPLIAATGAISISFWVKANVGETGTIIGSEYDPGAWWNRIQIHWSTPNIELYVRDDAGNVRQYTCISTIADSSYHHVVAVISPNDDVIELWIDKIYDGGTSGALGQINLATRDLNIGCLNHDGVYEDYTDMDIDEVYIFEKRLVESEIKRVYEDSPYSGAQRVGTGAFSLIYVASGSETLVYKIITGRVIDKVMGGEPNQPYIEFVGEDLGEIMIEANFTEEYTTATQISTVVDDVMDESGSGIYQDKDTTDRTIINKFQNENSQQLLQKLSETAHFATGETGAHFIVDPGGSLRWRKFGSFASADRITDGSDGNTPNIVDIQLRESMKAEPKLVNDVRVVIFEEEYYPIDQDAMTESAEAWDSPDPTDVGYPQSDAGDKVTGTASVAFNTTNPGLLYRMQVNFPDFDITGFDKIKFYMKHGAALSIDDFDVRMWRNSLWVTDYYEYAGLAIGAAAAWNEYTVNIVDLVAGAVGNPGKIIDFIEIRINDDVEIGVGGFRIDKLRFIRDEKYGSSSDATSQTTYGKRTLRLVDKTINNTTLAGYMAANIVAHRRYPTVIVTCRLNGKAQVGYRPPLYIPIYSLKDGLNGSEFQIQRATHRVLPGDYVVDLELIAVKTGVSMYDYKISPVSFDLEGELIARRKKADENALNAIHSTYLE